MKPSFEQTLVEVWRRLLMVATFPYSASDESPSRILLVD